MQKRKKYEKAFLQNFSAKTLLCDKVTEKNIRLGYTNINENKLRNERI